MGSADIVIIKDVFVQDIIQMLFTENDHMIETFPAKGTNDTFGEWILPRTSWGSWFVFHPELPYGLFEFIAINTIVITDHIFCGFIKSTAIRHDILDFCVRELATLSSVV